MTGKSAFAGRNQQEHDAGDRHAGGFPSPGIGTQEKKTGDARRDEREPDLFQQPLLPLA